MATVTPELVREVISTTLSDNDIDGLIVAAVSLYSNYLDGKDIVDDIELEIKRYTAAHFVSLRDATSVTEEEKIGDASIKYTKRNIGDASTGLKSTSWGQTAILFDPTGILSRLGMMKPVWYSL